MRFQPCGMSEEVRRKGGRFLRFAGAAGFFAKGFIYFFIGLLILLSAAGENEDESPQGVFKMIASLPSAAGTAILSILLVGLLAYAVWRLYEAFTGLGSTANEKAATRFFRHRLSPFISACVYLSYAAFCIRLLFAISSNPVCFPACWRDTTAGTVLLALLGLAFAIAMVTQLIPALTGSFVKDMRRDRLRKSPKLGKIFLIMGRIGFLGRAALFAALSALFWAYVFWPRSVSGGGSTISNALDILTGSTAGRAVLGLIGVLLIIYGLFAALNSYYKRFDTREVTGEV
jgi:uncharacterized protein DUF1206